MRHAGRIVARASVALTVVALASAGVGVALQRPEIWRPALVAASVAGSLACRALPALASYQFTAWVVATVAAGMIYPEQCLSVAGLDLKNKHLLTAMIQLVMFGMGTQMTLAEFGSLRRMSYPLAVGVALQFAVMPLVGYAIAMLLGLPPEIAAGVVLIGACSSGLASNVMSYIAEANLPLSLALTSIGTVTAPLTTPFWMWLLAGRMTRIDFVGMMVDIVKIVIVPIGAALLHDYLRTASPGRRRVVYALFGGAILGLPSLLAWGEETLAGQSGRAASTAALLAVYVLQAVLVGVLYHGVWRLWPTIRRVMPAVAMFGILFVTLVTIAKGRSQLLEMGGKLFAASVLHNMVGLVVGYVLCKLTRVDERSSRTIAMEVGIQNGGMASGLANEMGKIDTVGLAAAVFIPWMNISGSLLANYWKRRPPRAEGTAAEQCG